MKGNRYKILNLFIAVSAMLCIVGCVTFDKVNVDGQPLSPSATLSNNSTGRSASENIILDDFELQAPWWRAHNVELSFEKDVLKVACNKAGPLYDCFGKILPGLDFTNAQVIHVVAKAEGSSIPQVRFDFHDINKKESNGKPASINIKNDGQYRDYYINYTGRFVQGFPEKDVVDHTSIIEVVGFINPGGVPFTGNLYIDKIEMIPASSMPKGADAQEFDGVIDAFSEPVISWWKTDKMEMEVEKNALKVSVSGAGPKYECIGKKFASVDFRRTPVLFLRAKAVGEKVPEVRIQLQDANGYNTDAIPIPIFIKNDGEYRDYYLSYAGKFRQAYPEKKKVDAKEIIQLILFVNPGGAPYNGTLYFDEIKALSFDSVPPNIFNFKYGLVDDFESEEMFWWKNSDKVNLEIDNKTLKIVANNASGSADAFGKTIESTDFGGFPVLKFKARAEGDQIPELRIELKDVQGRVTNAEAVTQKISNNGKFSEYSVDFSDKFKQTTPMKATVSSDEIFEVIFSINNEKPFKGMIYLDDIRATAGTD